LQVYLEFARFGTREAKVTLDSRGWMKLCRECALLGDDLTPTDCDLIFCKVWGRRVWPALAQSL